MNCLCRSFLFQNYLILSAKYVFRFAFEDTQQKSTTMPMCQRQASSHVQAMYSYTSADDIQLNFMEGDIIAVMGERKDGWQYGENIHTKG